MLELLALGGWREVRASRRWLKWRARNEAHDGVRFVVVVVVGIINEGTKQPPLAVRSIRASAQVPNDAVFVRINATEVRFGCEGESHLSNFNETSTDAAKSILLGELHCRL